MELTLNRYKFDESYVLDSSSNKVKIDFFKADKFHKEQIGQRSDSDMGNIILRFFQLDGEYGNRIGIIEEIFAKLEIKPEDLDFLILTDNENGFDMEHFYKSEFIFNILSKIKNNEKYLIENHSSDFINYMKGIEEGIVFAEKAMKEKDLILFWRQ